MFGLGFACGVVSTVVLASWLAIWLFRGDAPIARRLGLWD